MKKLFFLSALAVGLLIAAPDASAQTASTLKSQYSNTVDTVSNTGSLTKYMISGAQRAAKSAAIVFYSTKISGTVAGTATLEASVDGSTWYSYFNSHDTAYSYTLTDVASQAFRWEVAQVTDLYFRVKVVGTGTMSTKIYGLILPR